MKRFLILFLLWPALALAGVAQEDVFLFDGVERHHFVYVPPNAGPDTPLVIALHGMGGNAANLRYGIGLTEAAERFGFAVVYPQGLRLPQGSRHWNAGVHMMAVNDLGYLSALARDLIARHNLSRQRTVVFGISMGGYMAYHMACRSDLPISAVISVAGSITSADWRSCTANETSLLHIHGKRDPRVRYTGGRHWLDALSGSPPIETLVTQWAQWAGAAPVRPLLRDAHVDEWRFLNAANGVEVQLLALPDFGHDWPSMETARFSAINAVTAFILRHDGRNDPFTTAAR